MSDRGRTRWFYADVEPVRSGWYEVRWKLGGKYLNPSLVHWNGKNWAILCSNGRRFPLMPMRKDLKDQWRGLAKQPDWIKP